MIGEIYGPEFASVASDVIAGVGAAGLSLGGLALLLGRRNYRLGEELKAVGEENYRMGEELKAAAEELSDSEQKLQLEPKTGLLHYQAFQEEFQKRTGSTHNRTADAGRQHGLLLADLDDFKALNDERLSYLATDRLALIPVAGILKEIVRPDSDVVCRFGGEEFIILLGDTDLEGAMTVSQKLQEEVNDIYPDKNSPDYHLGMTIMCTTFAQGTPLDVLMDGLHAGLKEAKQIPGKNQIRALQQELPFND